MFVQNIVKLYASILVKAEAEVRGTREGEKRAGGERERAVWDMSQNAKKIDSMLHAEIQVCTSLYLIQTNVYTAFHSPQLHTVYLKLLSVSEEREKIERRGGGGGVDEERFSLLLLPTRVPQKRWRR